MSNSPGRRGRPSTASIARPADLLAEADALWARSTPPAFAAVMGMAALRISLGIRPKGVSPALVAAWIALMAGRV